MTVVLWAVLLNGGWGYGYVFRTGCMFRLGIRACFRHLRVAFVGRMQYAPTRVTCRTSKYEYVFRTGYMFRLGIRTCFRHLRVAFVGRIQYAPTRVICRTSKYEYVFRTGYMFRLGIRPCFPNPVHVIHRNTDVFSERGTHDPSKYGRVFRIRRRRRRARGWRGG